MVRHLFILFTIFVASPVWALTNVIASIDKNPVFANESFVLQVTADDNLDGGAIDLSAVRALFNVGRTSVSSQTSTINGKTSRSTKWSIVLIAKMPGDYLIPEIEINGIKSNPITLQVLNESDQNAPKEFFISTRVSSKEAYVQQQITYQVRLFFAAELQRGSLSQPSLEGATIETLGEDQESTEIIDGLRYRVIERNYAISSLKSGEFVLKAPQFEGEVLVGSVSRSFFSGFGQTKTIIVSGEDIVLTIKPKPVSYKGQWLVSEFLALQEEWQSNGSEQTVNNFVVGQPITRTLTLTVAGVSEEQMPTLDFEAPDGIKKYPDQPTFNGGSFKEGPMQGKAAIQQVKAFALIINRPGNYTLPEIRIPWWDSQANVQRWEVLPAKTINVLANPNANDKQTNPFESNEPVINDPTIIYKHSWLQWLFLGMWVLTCLLWFLSFRFKKVAIPVAVSPNSWKALKTACSNNDGEKVLKLLVPWVNECFSGSNVSNLSQVEAYLADSVFTEQLAQLQECYYGKNQTTWKGRDFLIFLNSLQNGKNRKKATLIPALN